MELLSAKEAKSIALCPERQLGRIADQIAFAAIKKRCFAIDFHEPFLPTVRKALEDNGYIISKHPDISSNCHSISWEL